MLINRLPAVYRLLPTLLAGILMMAIVVGCLSGGPTRWEPERKIPFSPDDRAIAYTHRDAVYVARSQGDKHRKIFTAEPAQLISTPHWAPGQRGILFVVSTGARDEFSGNIGYEVHFWEAPENIWTDDESSAKGDTVELPERWNPGPTKRLFRAEAMNAVQIPADALIEWHPDGQQVIYLDTTAGRQLVKAFDRQSGTSRIVSPISNRSLAFSVSADGEYLQVASRGTGSTELWVGPFDESMADWRRIEDRSGPRAVPREEMPTASQDEDPIWLFDLRPQLAKWSPDSLWLAHMRSIDAESESSDDHESVDVVLTPVDTPDEQRSFSFPDDRLNDLHWEPGSARLGFLDGSDLLVIETSTGAQTDLAGALEVERFIGWSKTGDQLAYLLSTEYFKSTNSLLPTGHIVRWAPTDRHNLVVARHDGTLPKSRFNMMNIEAAQWGNQSAKLSFWATYMPSVSLLPPGDPAAVLDLDKDSIRWYPTDLAEYAHVGHYYLLNGEADQAIAQYSDALRKVDDTTDDEMPLLARNLNLWRGVAYRATDDRASADLDFVNAQENTIVEPEDAAGDWNADLLRTLTADRDILSTMISMGYVPIATEYAREIADNDTDMRRIQALCYLSLVYDSLGQHDAYTENIVEAMLPTLLASPTMPAEGTNEMLEWYLDGLTAHENIAQLEDAAKLRHGASLVTLAQSNPDHGNSLLRASSVFYRGAGDMAAETSILHSIATQN